MRFSFATTWMVKAIVVLGLMAALPGVAGAEPNCKCRYAGQSYALETCVCIVTSSGARTACCDKVLNNTSWTFTGDTCPIAAAPDQGPPLQAGDRQSRPAETAALPD